MQLAIDDFGTGYSSFGRLRNFAVDRLKIDGRFVSKLHNRDADRSLVTAIIRLAQTLGLGVVAEGVEEFAQLLHLQDEKCDEAQGALFSRPLTPADAEALLLRAREMPEASRTGRLRAIIARRRLIQPPPDTTSPTVTTTFVYTRPPYTTAGMLSRRVAGSYASSPAAGCRRRRRSARPP